MIFKLNGAEAQQALVAEAIALCDFPFEKLAASLQREGRTDIEVDWADLSRSRADEPAAGVHPVVRREVDGRLRVLGLFHPPPHTRIVLDAGLVGNPSLAAEVFLAEAAHAVDYHLMATYPHMRAGVWNILHGLPVDAPVTVTETGDVGHGHSWFDGAAGYGTWVGESFMEAFIRAFAPSVPVTVTLAHRTTPAMAAQVRDLLVPRAFFATQRGRTYHDAHARLVPARWFATSDEARAAGLRPCRTCL